MFHRLEISCSGDLASQRWLEGGERGGGSVGGGLLGIGSTLLEISAIVALITFLQNGLKFFKNERGQPAGTN